MEVKISTEKRFLVFYLQGSIDIVRASKLEKEIDKIYANFEGFHILFNLQKAQLISSSGFGLIIHYQRKKSSQGVKVAISNLSIENTRVMDLMGIEGMIEIYTSEEDFEKKCKLYF
jgi:anti-anti-sigma factor